VDKNPVVLIIEDDKNLSKMYAQKFKIEGFTPIIADDGQKGLDMIKQSSPSAILLDMILPKFTGNQILSEINKFEKKVEAPIIALTNLTEKEEEEKAISLGAKEYLVKAMHTPEEVVQKVKTYMPPPANTSS